MQQQPLTRDRIIAAAVDVIERDGVTAISMRKVASELGYAVMSLYNHVPSKDALLDGVAEYVLSGIVLKVEPDATWQDQVRAQARALRQIVNAYPRCAMIVVSRPSNSPTAIVPFEVALATLIGAGFDATQALGIVRVFIAYITGSMLRQVGVTPDVSTPEELGAAVTPHDPAVFPLLTSLVSQLVHRDFDAEFEFGLDLLVSAVTELHDRVARDT